MIFFILPNKAGGDDRNIRAAFFIMFNLNYSMNNSGLR